MLDNFKLENSSSIYDQVMASGDASEKSASTMRELRHCKRAYEKSQQKFTRVVKQNAGLQHDLTCKEM